MRYTFKKGDATKFVKRDEVAKILLADGWECPEYGEQTQEPDERDALKEKAVSLGIEFPKNIKTEKLKELIAEREEGDE